MEKLKKIFEIVIPGISALLVVVGFLSMIYILIFHGKEIPESVKNILCVFAGALSTTFVGLFNYWYGSSSGSKVKTELMDKINNPTVSNPV